MFNRIAVHSTASSSTINRLPAGNRTRAGYYCYCYYFSWCCRSGDASAGHQHWRVMRRHYFDSDFFSMNAQYFRSGIHSLCLRNVREFIFIEKKALLCQRQKVSNVDESNAAAYVHFIGPCARVWVRRSEGEDRLFLKWQVRQVCVFVVYNDSECR